MEKQIIIHRDVYENLTLRFQKKIEYDLQYVTNAGIPGLKYIYIFSGAAHGVK